MGYLLKDLPEEERPRERMMKYGVSSLTLQELLAIIIRTGIKGMSALDVASTIVVNYQRLDLLNEASVNELSEIDGIGKAKAVQILAAIELGKRINTPSKFNYRISTPKDTFIYLKASMQNLTQEQLYCLYLNGNGQILEEKLVTKGTVNQTPFHARDVFKWAIRIAASGIIIAHNHPTGDPTPSNEDIEITKIVIDASELFDIKLIDHIIIGKNKYYSFASNGLLF